MYVLTVLQAGLDFYQSQMVGTLPTNLSSDVSYRGDAFTYEADSTLDFADLTGGWCTGDEVGEHAFHLLLLSSSSMSFHCSYASEVGGIGPVNLSAVSICACVHASVPKVS